MASWRCSNPPFTSFTVKFIVFGRSPGTSPLCHPGPYTQSHLPVTASSSHKEIYHARFRQECSEVQRLASSTDALQLRLSSTSYLQPDPTAFPQIAFQSIQLTLEDLSRLMKVHLYTTASYAHMDHHYITFRKRKLPYRSQAATYTVNQKNVFFDIQSTKPDRL